MNDRASKVLRRYSRLLKNWDHKCVLCGLTFDDPLSITKEHLIPRSLMLQYGQKNTTHNNLAPSHHRCNSVRGNLSLSEAMQVIDAARTKLGEKRFRVWVNEPVPNRFHQNR